MFFFMFFLLTSMRKSSWPSVGVYFLCVLTFHLTPPNMHQQTPVPLFLAEALEFAEEQELSLEMMGRVRRALRRIEDAGGAGVMEGALSTMTEEDIEKFRMERDERHAKAANPRYVYALCSMLYVLCCLLLAVWFDIMWFGVGRYTRWVCGQITMGMIFSTFPKVFSYHSDLWSLYGEVIFKSVVWGVTISRAIVLGYDDFLMARLLLKGTLGDFSIVCASSCLAIFVVLFIFHVCSFQIHGCFVSFGVVVYHLSLSNSSTILAPPRSLPCSAERRRVWAFFEITGGPPELIWVVA